MNHERIAIIIPSYNEAKNVPILVSRIADVMPDAKVFVIDDSDWPEYMAIKKTIQKEFPGTAIIHREKKSGRESAVITGLREAFKQNAITHFFEMDADLTHDPQDFAQFLAYKNTADLVIGSRYQDKSVIKNWPVRRIVLSRLINWFLKFWLNLHLTDYTNGFRMYSRRAVQFLLTQNLREAGFIGLSETAYLIRRHDFTIAEVPITFTDRMYGKSSANLREHLESLKGAIRIKLR